jgi:hypothetical protein
MSEPFSTQRDKIAPVAHLGALQRKHSERLAKLCPLHSGQAQSPAQHTTPSALPSDPVRMRHARGAACGVFRTAG